MSIREGGLSQGEGKTKVNRVVKKRKKKKTKRNFIDPTRKLF